MTERRVSRVGASTWECLHGYPEAIGCPVVDCPDAVEPARPSLFTRIRWGLYQLVYGYKCFAEHDRIVRRSVAKTIAARSRPWWEQLGLEDIAVEDLDRDHGDECGCSRCAR